MLLLGITLILGLAPIGRAYQIPCGMCGPGIAHECIPMLMTCKYNKWDKEHTPYDIRHPHPLNRNWPPRDFPRCVLESALGVDTWEEERTFTCQLSPLFRSVEFVMFFVASLLVMVFLIYKCCCCLCCCRKSDTSKDRVVMLRA